MIVLDTNVVSELMRGGTGIERWLTQVTVRELYTTVMTRAEIRYGLALLPSGSRRDELSAQATLVFEENRDRLLTFDLRAADRYGEVVATRRRSGQPMSVQDAVIASITWVYRATLATRNVNDFTGCGIHVVDPFAA